MEWIKLAQDRIHWWALLNTAMNLWLLLSVGIFRQAEQELSTCQEGFHSMGVMQSCK